MHQHDRSKQDSASPSEPRWQGFTYVSQKHQKPQDSTNESPSFKSPSLQDDRDRVQRQRLLSQTPVGDRVRIITFHQFASNLTAAGLTSGITVQIVSRTASGSVIVSFQGKHLGIGAAIAQIIVVESL